MFLGVTWAVTAAVVGFMFGRLSMYVRREPEEAETGREAGIVRERETEREPEIAVERKRAPEPEKAAEAQKDGQGKTDSSPVPERRGSNRRKRDKAVGERKTWSVGSPVPGRVTANRAGEQAAVVIRPEEDCLYAPAGGKITRLFPMGNAFLFTTEFGAELYIQAGDINDELLARYYRPRILQNEVVGKGKLLLEFDRQGLEAEGVSAEVSVCVENCCYGGDVQATAAQWVDTGEEILQVLEPGIRSKY